jgi:hypothetical protein
MRRRTDRAHALEFHARYADAVTRTSPCVAIGSEREVSICQFVVSYVDRTVSLHANGSEDDPKARALAALVVLRHKGRVLDAVSGGLASLRSRLNADDRALLDQLSETNSRLANLALGGPGRTPPEEYRKRLAGLEESREKLESAISRRNAEFRAQSQPVTLAAIRPPFRRSRPHRVCFLSPFRSRALAGDGAFSESRYAQPLLPRWRGALDRTGRQDGHRPRHCRVPAVAARYPPPGCQNSPASSTRRS